MDEKNDIWEVITRSAEETEELGRLLASKAKGSEVVCLTGDLGSGKTVFAKGLAKGLGIKDSVASPTFTLVNEYEGEIPLYHMDLYRLESAEGVFDLGFEEYIEGGGITVIEWAERIKFYLPEEYLEVRFTRMDKESVEQELANGSSEEGMRCIELFSHGRRYRGLLEGMKKNASFRD